MFPTLIGTELGRVVDIAAIHYGHISCCETHTKIHMWGQCRGQSVVSPTDTPFKNMHDVFACFSTPAVTWKPIEAKCFEDMGIIEALKLAFDDPVCLENKIK